MLSWQTDYCFVDLQGLMLSEQVSHWCQTYCTSTAPAPIGWLLFGENIQEGGSERDSIEGKATATVARLLYLFT